MESEAKAKEIKEKKFLDLNVYIYSLNIFEMYIIFLFSLR